MKIEDDKSNGTNSSRVDPETRRRQLETKIREA